MTVLAYRTRHKQFRRIRHIYTTPANPATFIAYKRPPRPKIRRGRRFLLTRKAYVRPPLPATYIAYKRMPFLRPKIRRWKRFTRKVYPQGQPVPPLIIFKFKRPRIKRRRLVMRQKLYVVAPPPATFIAYRRPPRPKVKRWRKFIRNKLFAFLPPPTPPPLVWQRPRLLRPKVKRGRRFVIRHPYTTPLLPATFIAYRPFPRAKIKRRKWNLQRFKLRFYQFTGIPPIVSNVVDWLVRARRRGRR